MEHFHTDWEVLTTNDWIIMVTTVVIFLLMVGAYFYALRPKNRDRLETYKNMPFADDTTDNSGDKNGG